MPIVVAKLGSNKLVVSRIVLEFDRLSADGHVSAHGRVCPATGHRRSRHRERYASTGNAGRDLVRNVVPYYSPLSGVWGRDPTVEPAPVKVNV